MTKTAESLGSRVRRLRDAAGLSQEQLAQKLGISRPALTQVENDRRKLSPEELVALSQILDVTCDVLLGIDTEPEIVLVKDDGKKSHDMGMRISVPQRNVQKFREVLLHVLSRVGSRPHVGETVIYKLLYFIDFDYYEKYEEQLVGATYIRNTYGPTPVEFRDIVKQMQSDGDLEMVKSEHFNYPQRKYLPRRKPDLSVLSGRELELIEDVLRRLGDRNAADISAWSHGDVPWLGTKQGNPIPYEAVFYRRPQYSQRDYEEEDD
jgi:transcriptional regulator with XRE-family HTH domain